MRVRLNDRDWVEVEKLEIEDPDEKCVIHATQNTRVVKLHDSVYDDVETSLGHFGKTVIVSDENRGSILVGRDELETDSTLYFVRES